MSVSKTESAVSGSWQKRQTGDSNSKPSDSLESIPGIIPHDKLSEMFPHIRFKDDKKQVF